MADTSNQYNIQIEKCRALFINKMHDYGSAWRILRLPSLTDQIFIKAQRIRGLQKNKEQKQNRTHTTHNPLAELLTWTKIIVCLGCGKQVSKKWVWHTAEADRAP